MHILHLIKTSQGATWAINLLKEVKRKKQDIKFSVIIPTDGKHYNEYLEVCDNVIEFNYDLNSNIYSEGIRFKEIVLDLNPDIIHSWFTQTTLYARLFLRDINIPRIFQVVGPAHLENKLFNLGDVKSAQKNDYWIATSKYIFKKYMDAGIPKDRIFLNYAFIDTNIIVNSKKHITPINYKEKYSLKENTKIIGTASYIYPPKFYQKSGIKGHEHLLKSFKLLLEKRNDVVLVIAGSTFGNNNNYENKLKKIAKEIDPNKIFFTGSYQNIYETIGGFDVFIYLSKSENLGGVYESLLLEIPTISSNCGGLPELVINEETGYNLDPNNSEEIVQKIELILNNNLNINTLLGKNRVEEVFNKNHIINETIHIYNKIFNNHVQKLS
ncbi:glycosyltransferase family 4 protein [Empedobacter sp. 189-2]|uniref:glycosyltransferase family 4 protein n=1 Tax=Empedobacter sp. 189-2 TaxID=2746724 RepID=UPI002575187B|nr:glycosyltransferase family 4 protein [Empedobacter sp. 189-2]MDM1541800.1 glycosyltransferase family 4 protein [Empedobacter sp. 189-2]